MFSALITFEQVGVAKIETANITQRSCDVIATTYEDFGVLALRISRALSFGHRRRHSARCQSTLNHGFKAATGRPSRNHNPLQQSAITNREFVALNSCDPYQDGGLTLSDSALAKHTHAYAAFIEAEIVATHSASNHST